MSKEKECCSCRKMYPIDKMIEGKVYRIGEDIEKKYICQNCSSGPKYDLYLDFGVIEPLKKNKK